MHAGLERMNSAWSHCSVICALEKKRSGADCNAASVCVVLETVQALSSCIRFRKRLKLLFLFLFCSIYSA